MDAIAFVGVCFLCVFLFRDAQLLSAGESPAVRSPLHIYGLAVLASIVGASYLHAATAKQIMEELRSPWVWGISVGLHVAGLALCIWFRHKRLVKWCWSIALFPSPVLALLLLGISASLPTTPLGKMGTAILVAAGWTLLVGVTGSFIKRIGGSDSEFAVDFAAVSNSTALALLPLAPFL